MPQRKIPKIRPSEVPIIHYLRGKIQKIRNQKYFKICGITQSIKPRSQIGRLRLAQKRRIFHTIPIISCTTMLLLAAMAANPIPRPKTYATGTSKNQSDSTDEEFGSIASERNTTSHENAKPSSTSGEENSDVVEKEDPTILENDTGEPAGAGVPMTLADEGDDPLTLEISGNLDEVTPTYGGNTAYRSHRVHITTTGTSKFSLFLSSGSATDSAALTYVNDDGYKTPPNPVNPIENTNGEKGTNISINHWGYAWGEVSEADGDMTYYALPTYGNTGGTVGTGRLEYERGINQQTDFTKKLVFAAKIDPAMPEGHYTTKALLSLTAKPTTVTSLKWSNGVDSSATTMQEAGTIGASFCETNSMINPGDYITLIDGRQSEKSYKIMKMSDNKCWMMTNLALDLWEDGSGVTLTPNDSNVTRNWTSQAQSSAVWKSTDPSLEAYWDGDYNTMGSDMMSMYYHDPSYGYYYTFNAVTAGTGGDLSTDNQPVTQDICPKGWRLPTKDEYDQAVIKHSSSDPISISLSSRSSYISGASGYVEDNEGLSSTPSYSYYWTNVNSSKTAAYTLYIYYSGGSTKKTTTSLTAAPKYNGNTVRCLMK